MGTVSGLHCMASRYTYDVHRVVVAQTSFVNNLKLPSHLAAWGKDKYTRGEGRTFYLHCLNLFGGTTHPVTTCVVPDL